MFQDVQDVHLFYNTHKTFPKQSFSVGVLAAKEAPMVGNVEVGRRKTVVFMRVREHDLTHSAAVSLAFFFRCEKSVF